MNLLTTLRLEGMWKVRILPASNSHKLHAGNHPGKVRAVDGPRARSCRWQITVLPQGGRHELMETCGRSEQPSERSKHHDTVRTNPRPDDGYHRGQHHLRVVLLHVDLRPSSRGQLVTLRGNDAPIP